MAGPTVRICVVSGDQPLTAALVGELGRHGFAVSVIRHGADAVRTIDSALPQLVMVSMALPDGRGIDVCRALRDHSDVPIIMISQTPSEIDLVVALEIGADDFVVAPSPRELHARARALLRRCIPRPEPVEEDAVLQSGDLHVDPERHLVLVGGSPVEMPLKEFRLLELLLRNAGRVLTRGTLIDRIWGPSYFGDTNTLDVHIRRIRNKIETDPRMPERITTVRGVGYRFEAAKPALASAS